jgi:hypothetical protein
VAGLKQQHRASERAQAGSCHACAQALAPDDTFTHELVLPPGHRSFLEATLRVDALPPGPAGPASPGPGSAAPSQLGGQAAHPQQQQQHWMLALGPVRLSRPQQPLRYRVCFAPTRMLPPTSVELVVNKSSGGRWRFEMQLQVWRGRWVGTWTI